MHYWCEFRHVEIAFIRTILISFNKVTLNCVNSIAQSIFIYVQICTNTATTKCSHYHGSHMDWKTWRNEKTFSSQGQSREFYPNYWKSEENLASFYFFSDILMQVYLLEFFSSETDKINTEKLLDN